MSEHRHGSSLEFTSTRAAFAPPSPRVSLFPGFIARMRLSDSLVHIGLGYGLPSPSAYLGPGTFLDRPRVYPNTRGASEIWVRPLRDAGFYRG